MPSVHRSVTLCFCGCQIPSWPFLRRPLMALVFPNRPSRGPEWKEQKIHDFLLSSGVRKKKDGNVLFMGKWFISCCATTTATYPTQQPTNQPNYDVGVLKKQLSRFPETDFQTIVPNWRLDKQHQKCAPF